MECPAISESEAVPLATVAVLRRGVSPHPVRRRTSLSRTGTDAAGTRPNRSTASARDSARSCASKRCLARAEVVAHAGGVLPIQERRRLVDDESVTRE